MADDKITSIIKCQNMAPIENLTREIKSSSLKMGVFANNGSGKTSLSRLFRPTEKQDELVLDENGKSPADVGKLAHSVALYGAAKTKKIFAPAVFKTNVSSRRNYNDMKYALDYPTTTSTFQICFVSSSITPYGKSLIPIFKSNKV